MENIILVKNEYEIQIQHAKKTLWLGFLIRNPHGGPLPLPAVFSCAFQASYYASGILLRFCVCKRALLRA